jgi:GNAT superfamily N-acetyltransferase
MVLIVRLSKRLNSRPRVAAASGIALRCYRDPGDIELWLALRTSALPRPLAGGREWTEIDFQREFMAQPWWCPARMWLAVPAASAVPARVGDTPPEIPRVVGSVGLALGTQHGAPWGSVRWLMVAPDWRRRGIGRLLMGQLERCCWEANVRDVRVETLSAWKPALHFYRRLGYVPRTDCSGGGRAVHNEP